MRRRLGEHFVSLQISHLLQPVERLRKMHRTSRHFRSPNFQFRVSSDITLVLREDYP